MADLLVADDVRVVGHPAPAGLVLAAEPAAAAELPAAGYGARLVLPIGAHGHLVAYSRRERPGTRFHLGTEGHGDVPGGSASCRRRLSRDWLTPTSGPRSRATSSPGVKDPNVRAADGVWHVRVCRHRQKLRQTQGPHGRAIISEMRVLVASTSGAGHRLPLAPFADALQARGDEVRRLAGEPPRDERWEAFPQMSKREQSIFVEREWFGRVCTAAMRPAVEAACDELRPELIVREPCEYASAIAAHERGIPFVTVAITNARGEWGALEIAAPALPDAVVAAVREAPYVTRFPASLDPSPFPDTRRYAERQPLPATGARSFVYATFGTVAAGIGYDPYRALLDAVDGLDVRVLLTTGTDLDLGAVPENVRVERWVPQEEALAQASLVVCHGGSGTVLGTLAAGVPLVIMPLFADQLANARTLSEAGAAVVVDASGLRAAIEHPPAPPLALARELRAAPPPLTALRPAP